MHDISQITELGRELNYIGQARIAGFRLAAKNLRDTAGAMLQSNIVTKSFELHCAHLAAYVRSDEKSLFSNLLAKGRTKKYHNKRNVIIPSARKGIHSDCNICASKELWGMGKYGLNDKACHRSKNLRNHPNTSQEGADEVDNVQSKHAIPSRFMDNLNRARRNSVDSLNNIYSDESDDENISQEYDSIETITNSFSPERIRINNSNISKSSKSSPHSLQIDRHLAPKTPQNEYLANNNESQWKQLLIASVIAIIVGIIYYWYDDILKTFNHNLSENIINVYDERKFHNDVIHLGEKYKVTDDSILQIQSGISTIFQRQDTGSFIFTYNSKNANFNPTHFNNFMNDISSAASRYLRNESDIHNHVTVDSTKLDMRVHSELIERYRDDVTRTGVMLVKDVDEVPAKLAMAFHYYCDEFNPLIKRSAIFFTLNMARCSDQKTSHASIEKCLTNKWTAVPKVNIVPLLARVVSIVVDVTSVF